MPTTCDHLAVPSYAWLTKVLEAAELEALTPQERERLFAERVVTDLSQVSAEFLAKVRAEGRALLEEHGVIARQTDAS